MRSARAPRRPPTSARATSPPSARAPASSKARRNRRGVPHWWGAPTGCQPPPLLHTDPTTEGGNVSAPTAGPDDGTPTLELRGVNKSFGAIQVLHDVHLTAFRGQVTALVGDNGAGKSTLIKSIAGIHPVDSGRILFEGKEVHIGSPKDAADLGIEVVYQDLALADNLDIAQNMFLGRERKRGIVLDEASMEQSARETLARLSVRPAKCVRQPVASLSGGQRQTVAIAKAVLWESKVVILDEPTAALGVAQTRQVLDLVRRLADTGHAVIFIPHNMLDVFEVSDRVAALYLGRVAADVPISEVDRPRVIELITAGRSGDLGIAPAAIAEVGV